MRLIHAVIGAALALGASAASAQNANWPKSMTMGTASVGGTFFVYGQVWANLAGEAVKVPISTQQTQGPNQNIILTNDRQTDLGMTTLGIALQAWNGIGDWTQGKKFQNIRAIFPMYDTAFHFVTTDKTGITSVKQLAGKRVGLGPKAGTPGTYFPLMFDALNLKVDLRYGGASDMANNLGDGLLDVFAFAAGLPFPAYAEIEAQRPVVYFSFAEDEIKTLLAKFPELSRSKIPANTYKMLKQDQATVGVFNFAIAHKDLPDDLVYGIVKAVMENNKRMVDGHSAAVETVNANVAKNSFLPFHPGAAKYFREKGVAIPDKLVMR